MSDVIESPEENSPAGTAQDFTLASPGSSEDWNNYFDLRWRVLRQPWNQPKGSERDELDKSAFHLLLRHPSGGIIAIGRLHSNSPDEAQVRYMAVEPGWRGKRLGSRVLKGLEGQALAQGAKTVVLNAREEAVSFYLEHGYQVEGPAETLFGEIKHLRMRKSLAN